MNHLELYDCILDKLNDTATEAELIGLRDVCQRGLVRTQMRLDDLEAAKPKKPGPKPGSSRAKRPLESTDGAAEGSDNTEPYQDLVSA